MTSSGTAYRGSSGRPCPARDAGPLHHPRGASSSTLVPDAGLPAHADRRAGRRGDGRRGLRRGRGPHRPGPGDAVGHRCLRPGRGGCAGHRRLRPDPGGCVGLGRPHGRAWRPTPAPGAPRDPLRPPCAPAAAPPAVPPRPVSSSPYLSVDAPVVPLRLGSGRRMSAPPDDDSKRVGWYADGPPPANWAPPSPWATSTP
ncbi:hypothetical protein ACRAWF_14555 [Streptomyces sp. L7]